MPLNFIYLQMTLGGTASCITMAVIKLALRQFINDNSTRTRHTHTKRGTQKEWQQACISCSTSFHWATIFKWSSQGKGRQRALFLVLSKFMFLLAKTKKKSLHSNGWYSNGGGAFWWAWQVKYESNLKNLILYTCTCRTGLDWTGLDMCSRQPE